MIVDTKAETDTGLIWTVPLTALKDLADPMADDIWGVGVITPEEVIACRDNSAGRIPYSQVLYGCDDRNYHIARISWLAEHGWEESGYAEYPISVDLYADASYSWHPIIDGNHRFVASVLLGLETVEVSVSGDIDYAMEVLSPVDF